jgi:hypothetical protein
MGAKTKRDKKRLESNKKRVDKNAEYKLCT